MDFVVIVKRGIEGTMKVAFHNDESFAFEFVRNSGFMYYGGSDLGEMIATAGLVKEGDEESGSQNLTSWRGGFCREPMPV